MDNDTSKATIIEEHIRSVAKDDIRQIELGNQTQNSTDCLCRLRCNDGIGESANLPPIETA